MLICFLHYVVYPSDCKIYAFADLENVLAACTHSVKSQTTIDNDSRYDRPSATGVVESVGLVLYSVFNLRR